MTLKPRSTKKVHVSTDNEEKIISRINIRPKLDFYRSSIYEYDIDAAGYSILKKIGALSSEEINFLEKESKINRNIYIGNLMKEDSRLIDDVEKGLLQALNKFLLINNVKKTDILSVKRDSVFILKKASSLQIKDGISFKLAHKYSGFINLADNIEAYYSFNFSGYISELDVKGISDKKINDHKYGILNLIKYLLEKIHSKKQASQLLSSFDKIKKNYLNLVYSVEFYRELNKKSYYRLKDTMLNKSFLVKDLSEENKDKLDIAYNYKHILLPIMSSALN